MEQAQTESANGNNKMINYSRERAIFPYTLLDSENSVITVEIGGVRAGVWGKKNESILLAAVHAAPRG